jgi:hypothetical protein
MYWGKQSMKAVLIILSSALMPAYVTYRAFATFVILPLSALLPSPIGIYFVLLTLIAAVATVLSFTRRKGMAATPAAIVGLVPLCRWFYIIHTAPVWTRTIFIWFVVPEVCFSLAGLSKWWACRSNTDAEAHLSKVLND